MKYTLSVLTALLLLGCSDSGEQQVSPKAAESALPSPVAAQAVANDEPAKAPSAPKEAVAPAADLPLPDEPAAQEVATAPDGKTLFERCIACHGAKAEKQALGKSQVIATWDAAKIASALKGYRDGVYGGAMKALMEGQVREYSDADIEAVAKYIESF